MSSNALARLKALLFADDAVVERLAHEATSLRHAFDELDDLEFTPAELERLRERPQLLVRFYNFLTSDEVTEADESGYGGLLESLREEKGRQIAEAFEMMASDLPTDLVNWEQWFSRADMDAQYAEYIRSQPSVRLGGPHAHALLEFGLTPETIAGAARGIRLLLDSTIRTLRVDDPTYPGVVMFDQDAHEILQAHVATTPWLPKAAIAGLTCWVVSVSRIRPYFVLGYESHPIEPDRIAFVARSDLSDDATKDLMALWTRQAYFEWPEEVRNQMSME